MDKDSLVSSGHALVKAMDKSGIVPRLAMWVHSPDADTWKLWLVPPAGRFKSKDKREFYIRIAKLIAEERDTLGNIDVSDVEMILDTHPVAIGMRGFLRMPGLGSAHFSGNVFNGFYLPDGIVLRCDL